jgi:hypothetical protein
LKSENDKLSHEELDKQISILDTEISNSQTTKDNEIKMLAFKESFLKAVQDNTFVKRPIVTNNKQFTPIKVMVPKDFSLQTFTSKDPLCLSKSEIPLSAQLNQLNKQMISITSSGESNKKPRIHQIYFAWGWNRDYHSNTDVKFTTPDGTFTIHDTHSTDRPSPFDPKIYFSPSTLSIPHGTWCDV